MKFYLGVHPVHWLERTGIPLFISRRRLVDRRKLLRPLGPWILDSGGFSELSIFGTWQTSSTAYVQEVRRWRDWGNLEGVVCQDWMCEPVIREKTGKTVAEHQLLTVQSYLDLLTLAPEVPWIPVLQGWHPQEYFDHLDLYARHGIDLRTCSRVGVGSICRRQDTAATESVISGLKREGLILHLFGFKVSGLRKIAGLLTDQDSSDSMAWSFQARREPPLSGHTHHSCANCLEYALLWRERVLASILRGQRVYQPSLF